MTTSLDGRHRRFPGVRLAPSRGRPAGALRPPGPCDLSGTSPTRKVFSQGAHGKPLWMIVAYWQQEIASGRSEPPLVCPTEQAALQAVRENPEGVAYVAEGLPLGSGARALSIEP